MQSRRTKAAAGQQGRQWTTEHDLETLRLSPIPAVDANYADSSAGFGEAWGPPRGSDPPRRVSLRGGTAVETEAAEWIERKRREHRLQVPETTTPTRSQPAQLLSPPQQPPAGLRTPRRGSERDVSEPVSEPSAGSLDLCDADFAVEHAAMMFAPLTGDPSTVAADMRKFAKRLERMYLAKSGSLLDELAENLVFPPGADPPSLLTSLANKLHDDAGSPGLSPLELLVYRLSTQMPQDIDRDFGFAGVPPPPRQKEPPEARVHRDEYDKRFSDWEWEDPDAGRSRSLRNGSVADSVLAAIRDQGPGGACDLVSERALRRWTKTVCTLVFAPYSATASRSSHADVRIVSGELALRVGPVLPQNNFKPQLNRMRPGVGLGIAASQRVIAGCVAHGRKRRGTVLKLTIRGSFSAVRLDSVSQYPAGANVLMGGLMVFRVDAVSGDTERCVKTTALGPCGAPLQVQEQLQDFATTVHSDAGRATGFFAAPAALPPPERQIPPEQTPAPVPKKSSPQQEQAPDSRESSVPAPNKSPPSSPEAPPQEALPDTPPPEAPPPEAPPPEAPPPEAPPLEEAPPPESPPPDAPPQEAPEAPPPPAAPPYALPPEAPPYAPPPDAPPPRPAGGGSEPSCQSSVTTARYPDRQFSVSEVLRMSFDEAWSMFPVLREEVGDNVGCVEESWNPHHTEHADLVSALEDLRAEAIAFPKRPAQLPATTPEDIIAHPAHITLAPPEIVFALLPELRPSDSEVERLTPRSTQIGTRLWTPAGRDTVTRDAKQLRISKETAAVAAECVNVFRRIDRAQAESEGRAKSAEARSVASAKDVSLVRQLLARERESHEQTVSRVESEAAKRLEKEIQIHRAEMAVMEAERAELKRVEEKLRREALQADKALEALQADKAFTKGELERQLAEMASVAELTKRLEKSLRPESLERIFRRRRLAAGERGAEASEKLRDEVREFAEREAKALSPPLQSETPEAPSVTAAEVRTQLTAARSTLVDFAVVTADVLVGMHDLTRRSTAEAKTQVPFRATLRLDVLDCDPSLLDTLGKMLARDFEVDTLSYGHDDNQSLVVVVGLPTREGARRLVARMSHPDDPLTVAVREGLGPVLDATVGDTDVALQEFAKNRLKTRLKSTVGELKTAKDLAFQSAASLSLLNEELASSARLIDVGSESSLLRMPSKRGAVDEVETAVTAAAAAPKPAHVDAAQLAQLMGRQKVVSIAAGEPSVVESVEPTSQHSRLTGFDAVYGGGALSLERRMVTLLTLPFAGACRLLPILSALPITAETWGSNEPDVLAMVRAVLAQGDVEVGSTEVLRGVWENPLQSCQEESLRLAGILPDGEAQWALRALAATSNVLDDKNSSAVQYSEVEKMNIAKARRGTDMVQSDRRHRILCTFVERQYKRLRLRECWRAFSKLYEAAHFREDRAKYIGIKMRVSYSTNKQYTRLVLRNFYGKLLNNRLRLKSDRQSTRTQGILTSRNRVRSIRISATCYTKEVRKLRWETYWLWRMYTVSRAFRRDELTYVFDREYETRSTVEKVEKLAWTLQYNVLAELESARETIRKEYQAALAVATRHWQNVARDADLHVQDLKTQMSDGPAAVEVDLSDCLETFRNILNTLGRLTNPKKTRAIEVDFRSYETLLEELENEDSKHWGAEQEHIRKFAMRERRTKLRGSMLSQARTAALECVQCAVDKIHELTSATTENNHGVAFTELQSTMTKVEGWLNTPPDR
eukprot:Hpha_TRINITY_DN5721_c0_g1::TRINITY_DN5721_c0_g1_i1::g.147640::m.147640